MKHKLTPSYGRRKSRKLRVQSQHALEESLPSLTFDCKSPSFNQSTTETWIEIGFGHGEHLLEQIARNPSVSFVGCEPFQNGIASFLKKLPPESWDRVRIWPEDVRYLLETLPREIFSRAFILFPDPWPKKRHHKKRLLSSEFLETFLPTLKEDGQIYVASDDPSYVEQIQEVFGRNPLLSQTEGPSSPDPQRWGERPPHWPPTRYEQKAYDQGKKCAYMVFLKRRQRS